MPAQELPLWAWYFRERRGEAEPGANADGGRVRQEGNIIRIGGTDGVLRGTENMTRYLTSIAAAAS